MKTNNSISTLKASATPCSTNWLDVAKKIKENKSWLEKSAKISARVLSLLREKSMTKQELATQMGVTPQYISKLVKGNENFTIETISKLENILGAAIIDVRSNKDQIELTATKSVCTTSWINGRNMVFTELQEENVSTYTPFHSNLNYAFA